MIVIEIRIARAPSCVVQIKEVQIRITDAPIESGASASPVVRARAAPKFTDRYFRHVPADASGEKVRLS
ncbi:MAG: hypothetical protein DMF84_16145 [Acidobacteria bacterium]|nr:MAG: hypothetical protein DMF84_16145 [Acidobacteriota bacterium]